MKIAVNEIKRLESKKDLDKLELGDKIEAELNGSIWKLIFIKKEEAGFRPTGYYEFKGISDNENLAMTYHCFLNNIGISEGKIVQKYLLSCIDFISFFKGTENYEIIKKSIEGVLSR